MRKGHRAEDVDRQIPPISGNTAECKLHRLLGKGREHDDGFEEVADGLREGAVVCEGPARDDAWFEEDGRAYASWGAVSDV